MGAAIVYMIMAVIRSFEARRRCRINPQSLDEGSVNIFAITAGTVGVLNIPLWNNYLASAGNATPAFVTYMTPSSARCSAPLINPPAFGR